MVMKKGIKSGEGVGKGRSEAERSVGPREVEGGRVDRGREGGG